MAIIYPSRNSLVGDQTISGRLTASSGVSVPSSSAYQIGNRVVLQQNQFSIPLFNNVLVAGVTGSTQIVSGSDTNAFLAVGNTKLYPYNTNVGNAYFAKGRWTVIQGGTLGVNIESSGSEANGGISIDSWGSDESISLTSHNGKTIISSSQGTEVSGNLTIAGILTAQQLNITYVTSSILYSSGSTKFGDTSDDTHQFSGSVFVSGSITANSFVGIPTRTEVSGAVTSSLSAYATLSGISASFTTPAQVTGAITNFANRAEISGALTSSLVAYATLTGVSGTFTTPSQITGALNPYALASNVSASFVDNSELTSAIQNFSTRAEVTGAVSTFSTRSEVTGVLANYATLTGVSGTFTTPSQVTSALTPYALIADVSASFIDNSELTSALSSYATLIGVSASFTTPAQVTGAISTFSTRSEVTGALTAYATLTGVSASFTTPAQVTGAFSTVTAKNAETASYIASGSAIATFTNDVRNQFSAGTGVTITSGQVSIGQAVATSSNVIFNNTVVSGNFDSRGGFSSALRKITGSITASASDHVILANASTAALTVSLPQASTTPNERYIIKKTDTSANQITINPYSLLGPLSASYTQKQILSGSFASSSNDYFGYRLAIDSSGSRIVVGAYQDEVISSSQGLAYIYDSGSSGWVQTVILSGSYAIDINDNFGRSVAITPAGTRIIVAATADETTGSTGYGLVYIFDSGSSGWIETAVISGSEATSSGDLFGASLAINNLGNRIVVGASSDEISSSGLSNTGLVYIFDSGSGGWLESAVFSGSLIISNDGFGTSVSINSSGERIVVGATSAKSGSVSGGLAYVYDSGSGGWTEAKILSGTYAIQSGDAFGYSAYITNNGNRIFIGAYSDEVSFLNSGLVYVFDSSSSGWSETTVLSGSYSLFTPNYFGSSVKSNVAGDVLIVGAFQDETGSSPTLSQGLAYLFQSSSIGWRLQQVVTGSRTLLNDLFGVSVDIDSVGKTIVVGAYLDELNGFTDTGLAYVFTAPYIADKIDEISSSLTLLNTNEKVELISDGTGSWYTI